VAAGGDLAKGEVRSWNTQQDQSLADLPTPGPCMGVDIHPEGQQFAVATLGKDSGALLTYEWTN
jgi:hypothetical protein